MDLLWLDGDLVIAGPDTHAYISTPHRQEPVTGIRLSGGVGPAAIGVPAHEVRNLRVPAREVWGARTATALREQVAAADAIECELERIIGTRLERRQPDPVMRQVDAMARSGYATSAIARAAGLSERQLRRRTHVAFGYGVKTLSRIHRFNAALDLAREGVPLVDAAAQAVYADQPHFTREARALTGEPLSALLR